MDGSVAISRRRQVRRQPLVAGGGLGGGGYGVVLDGVGGQPHERLLEARVVGARLVEFEA